MPPSDPVDPLTPTLTAEATTLTTQPTARPIERALVRELPAYELGEVIGRGGMGEVVVAHDRRIDRDVALKRMHATNPAPELVERFLREAKIQARLDHPAIAPVHELGYDEAGLPFFTMKRLSGTTLAAVLEAKTETLQRLLRALVDVGLAVELAHSRRVVHRDLKPTNIMLGDYGEVYVLDWGVARVLSRASTAPPTEEVEAADGMTKAGSLLGTPGYMAPEQARGEPVGTAADVYALGSILFEILAGEPLHARHGALASTLGDVDCSPAHRCPERTIAPELDEVTVAALALDPAARPTARQLADAIQRYLDGDRDAERRRTVAVELASAARVALANGDRAQAIRTAGRALAFDPQSPEISALVMSLVVDEPPEVPVDVEHALEAEEIRMTRVRSRRAVLPYAAIFVLVPLLPLLHVLDWSLLTALFVGFGVMVTVTWLNSRVAVPIALTLTGHAITVLLFSRILGPFIITPIMICAILLSVSGIPWLNRRWWAVSVWATVTASLPFAVEWLGLLAPTWSMTGGGVLSHGAIFDVEIVNIGLVIASNIAAVVIVGAYARRIGGDRRDAQRKLFIQAWHLRNLLPQATRSPGLVLAR